MDSILEPLLVILLPIWLVYGYLELQARMGGKGKAVRRRNHRRKGDGFSGKAAP